MLCRPCILVDCTACKTWRSGCQMLPKVRKSNAPSQTPNRKNPQGGGSPRPMPAPRRPSKRPQMPGRDHRRRYREVPYCLPFGEARFGAKDFSYATETQRPRLSLRGRQERRRLRGVSVPTFTLRHAKFAAAPSTPFGLRVDVGQCCYKTRWSGKIRQSVGQGVLS
jgi:hypothetical protein